MRTLLSGYGTQFIERFDLRNLSHPVGSKRVSFLRHQVPDAGFEYEADGTHFSNARFLGLAVTKLQVARVPHGARHQRQAADDT